MENQKKPSIIKKIATIVITLFIAVSATAIFAYSRRPIGMTGIYESKNAKSTYRMDIKEHDIAITNIDTGKHVAKGSMYAIPLKDTYLLNCFGDKNYDGKQIKLFSKICFIKAIRLQSEDYPLVIIIKTGGEEIEFLEK